MKNQTTVKELKELGYYTFIYHGRTHIANDFIGPDSDSHIKITSRRDARIEGLDQTHKVYCKGGFTYIELTNSNGDVKIGKYNFNKNEHFDRKFGLKIALGRALAKFEK